MPVFTLNVLIVSGKTKTTGTRMFKDKSPYSASVVATHTLSASALRILR